MKISSPFPSLLIPIVLLATALFSVLLFSSQAGTPDNTAVGAGTLNSTTGIANTATGYEALFQDTTGKENTASGYQALQKNTTADNNTAIGYQALQNNILGSDNAAFGWASLYHTTGSFNIGLGDKAGFNLTNGKYNIDIGNQGVAGESQTIRIGDNNQTRAFVFGIYGVSLLPANNPLSVVIDQNGQLGTTTAAGLDENISHVANTKGNTAAENVNALTTIASGTGNGTNNTATGWSALTINQNGSDNTATGWNALTANTNGGSNTATGSGSLFSNTTAGGNTATGYQALYKNTIGGANTATGYAALYSNSAAGGQQGVQNTADGNGALYSNTGGQYNTAIGYRALFANTMGNRNTATGVEALNSNTTGEFNTADGHSALHDNKTGNRNTAVGIIALSSNKGGHYNTAMGWSALGGIGATATDNENTAVGYGALAHLTTGTGNVGIGANVAYNVNSGSNNIYISNQGANTTENGFIRIGTQGTHAATFIAGITTAPTLTNAATVVIDPATGQLGSHGSSERFKKDVKPMDSSSNVLFRLDPVTFHYKNDDTATPQFGLIAEEVEKVNPDLIVRDADGKPYSVRYDAVNAMLLNEFLKEHNEIGEQQTMIAELKAAVAKEEVTIAAQQETLEALAVSLKEQQAKIAKISVRSDTTERVSRVADRGSKVHVKRHS